MTGDLRHWARLSLVLLAVALALAGCSAPATRPDLSVALEQQARRESQLDAMRIWSLTGRIAVSNGTDGGSGKLDWGQDHSTYRLELQAPVSRQTWRLQVTPGWARLEGLEGGAREAADPVDLLAREVGWQLPLENLGAWVRGARGPGPATLEFDSEGLPQQLVQEGWTVDYRSWDLTREPPLPKRVFAKRGDQTVRLVITGWSIPD